MIETLGFIGAVEAADAAVKTANVKIVKYASVDGGLAFQHIGILSLEFHVDKLSRPLL